MKPAYPCRSSARGGRPGSDAAGARSTRVAAQSRGAIAAGVGPRARVWVQGEMSNLSRPGLRPLVFLAQGPRRAAALRHVPPAQHARALHAARRPAGAGAAVASACTSRAATISCWSSSWRTPGVGALQRAFEELQGAPGGRGPVRRRAQARAARGAARASASSPRPPARRSATSCTSWRGAFPAAAVLIYPVAGAGRGRRAGHRRGARAGRARAPSATC